MSAGISAVAMLDEMHSECEFSISLVTETAFEHYACTLKGNFLHFEYIFRIMSAAFRICTHGKKGLTNNLA